ncbi:MAG: glycosyltransferase family 2 protein [Pseudomonadota bacterium]
MMTVVFWLSAGLIIYTYFGYPVLLTIASAFVQMARDLRFLLTRRERRVSRAGELPSVTVLVAAYNEESCISERVENLLALDYPEDRLEVLVGSDGSTDRTAEILSSIEDPRFKSHCFDENRGKISVLNDLMLKASGDVVVMTDANTVYQPDTVRMLVRHFSDEAIGAVCGELQLIDKASGQNRDGAYWRYEQVLKFHESRLGALLGANGAIYAIRRMLYEPLPADTIVDDFQIAMNIARKGLTVVYDPESVASEPVAPDLRAEHGRRVRIGAGNYQSISRVRWALNPRAGWRWFTFVSHKLLRWFVPHLMVLALVTNLLLIELPRYRVLLAGQLLFYALAIYGLLRLRAERPNGFLVSLASFFLAMNAALLQGFVRFLRADLGGAWSRTRR